MSQHGRQRKHSSSSTKQHPHDTAADTGSEAALVRLAPHLFHCCVTAGAQCMQPR